MALTDRACRPRPTRDDAWRREYRPRDAWFAHQVRGLHGAGHAARVLVWANRLARQMQVEGVSVDVEVVRRAAVLHDIRRLDDGRDPAHGRRCRAWVAAQPLLLGACTASQREAVGYCCEWHVPPDDEAPRMTPELMCLTDADALDRVRLGGPDRRRLRTTAAQRWVRAAEMLCDLSEAHAQRGLHHWDAVMRAAGSLSLLPMAVTAAPGHPALPQVFGALHAG